MGALFLASKLEESPLRIRDIINSYSYLQSLVSYCSAPPYPPPSSYAAYAPMDYFATEFYDMKDALVIAEMQILKRLGFQTQCGLPYGHLVNYLQVLELTGEKELVSRCWSFCNDMCVFFFSLFPSSEPNSSLNRSFCRRLQTPSPALYPQSTLALSAIYLSCRLASPPIALPLEPAPWWTLFDATEDDILDVTSMLLRLYKDWGSSPVGEMADSTNGSMLRKENVWRRAKRIPTTKSGVKEALSGLGRGNSVAASPR